MNIQNQLDENILVFPHLNVPSKKKRFRNDWASLKPANSMREHNFYEYPKLARLLGK